MTDLVDLGKHSLQRGHPPFINILSPLLLVTHPILEFFNPPPPPPTSWHLSLSLIVSKYITSICIKSCYDNMMEAIKEQWFLSVKQD